MSIHSVMNVKLAQIKDTRRGRTPTVQILIIIQIHTQTYTCTHTDIQT